MAYIGQEPTVGIYRTEFLSGDNTTTSFPLSYDYGNEASIVVCISGVKQKSDSYGLVNGQLIFLTPPPAGTQNIEVLYLAERRISLSVANILHQANTANGTGNTYNIPGNYSVNNILVFYNGIAMMPTEDYTVTGTVLRFTFTPVANSNVSIRFLAPTA